MEHYLDAQSFSVLWHKRDTGKELYIPNTVASHSPSECYSVFFIGCLPSDRAPAGGDVHSIFAVFGLYNQPMSIAVWPFFQNERRTRSLVSSSQMYSRHASFEISSFASFSISAICLSIFRLDGLDSQIHQGSRHALFFQCFADLCTKLSL